MTELLPKHKSDLEKCSVSKYSIHGWILIPNDNILNLIFELIAHPYIWYQMGKWWIWRKKKESNFFLYFICLTFFLSKKEKKYFNST